MATGTPDSTIERTETRRTISPYDLTAAYNPDAVISYPLLKGSNYDEWAVSFKTAMSSRKKFEFLDGSITKPNTNSPNFEDWDPVNALLVSWIKMTIHESLCSSISHREMAKDLWDNLKKRFYVSSGPRYQQVMAELATCRQQGQSIEMYFGRIPKIWDTLNTIRPLRVCKCGTCTCDLMEQMEKDKNEDRLQQFLYGLDEALHSIRSNILARTPIPPVEEAYNLLRQEEDLLSHARQHDDRTETMAFAVKIQSKPRGERSLKVICDHCKRSGHSIAQCFEIIGYPEWWSERTKSRTGPSRQWTTNVPSARALANAATISTSAATQQIKDVDREGISGLSDEQWKTVMRALNAVKPSNSNQLTGMDLVSSSWILDTGCSHHMTGKQNLLLDIHNVEPVFIILADGTERFTNKAGTVRLSSQLSLQSVYLVDGLKTDLISVGQLLDENKCTIQMSNRFLIIQDRISKMVTGVGKRENGTFMFRGLEIAAVSATRSAREYDLWHQRYGHPSETVLNKVSDISVLSNNKSCDICLRAKKTRNSFSLSSNKATSLFELIHINIWGPYRTASSSGARFFLTIVDDHTRSVWIYLMKHKSETQKRLQEFITLIKRQFSTSIKKIRSDNGSEFTSMKSFFKGKGIIHELSCVYTPNQNGRVERKHRHILNVARALRFQASLPIDFWGECILTAGFLINRTPTPLLEGKTPYELLYGKAPSSAHLRVFGSLCYASNVSIRGDKFAPRSRRCIFVGYPFGQKAWRLFDLEEQCFFTSRDVTFIEDTFPYASDVSSANGSAEMIMDGPISQAGLVDLLTTTDALSSSTRQMLSSEQVISDVQPMSPDSITGADTEDALITAPVLEPALNSLEPQPRRGQRHRQPPTRLRDYVNSTVTRQPEIDTTSSSRYPIANYVSSERFSTTHRAFQTAITVAEVPITYKEAVGHKEWRDAIAAEVEAQLRNGTLEITDLPPNKRAIGSKWVFTNKFNSDGTLERHKARLVALGNRQKAGRDYDETFAPVAKMNTVRVFLKCAAVHNWVVYQMDVHNAFLHGDLTEEVYMYLPQGFHTLDTKKVCRLRKSLYGLKQAPRCWFAKLSSALIEYGFRQSIADYSLFVLTTGSYELRILIYVDDLIVMGSSETEVSRFKNYLAPNFHMKDLGVLKYFLGLEVARNKDGFFLCQRKYALDIITETGLLGAKPKLIPLSQNHGLALSQSSLLEDPLQYRRLVGKLIYLANTRPDLSYSVHILAQFMKAPTVDHWESALQVVRYLKNSPGQGILLSSIPDTQLHGWCDSDWGSCPVTRRSVTGYVVQLGDSSISWKTKKQNTVSRSSAEAEYRAMAHLVQELIWLKRLLGDLGFAHKQPMKVYSDSKSALDLAKNPVFHERTKHVGIDCHFIRDEIIARNVSTHSVSSGEQIADILTKPLSRQELQAHNVKLSIIDIHAPLEGG